MFAKNEVPVSVSALAYRRELQYLYARRSAIDSLIESLEEYGRVRETGTKGSGAGAGRRGHHERGRSPHVPAREGRGFWR
jgi:hypothetical protein